MLNDSDFSNLMTHIHRISVVIREKCKRLAAPFEVLDYLLRYESSLDEVFSSEKLSARKDRVKININDCCLRIKLTLEEDNTRKSFYPEVINEIDRLIQKYKI